jgi:trehalose synthase
MREIPIEPRPLSDLADVLPVDRRAALNDALARAREALDGRVFWNVNSTRTGGGVAESLHTLLGYLLVAGIRTRWLVIDGNDEFFAATKCLHNALHGFGDMSELDAMARAAYEQTITANTPGLMRSVRPDDVVLLHDPQTAGLVRPVKQVDIKVAWRSHIGRDTPNQQSAAGWEFLRPYVQDADALVFSRRHYAPAWAQPSRVRIIPPSIDPLAAKNRPLSAQEYVRILVAAGLIPVTGARLIPEVRGAPLPDPGVRLVVQVSRWDRLKDMAGVMAGFAAADLPPDVHLMLAGPAVTGVSDDPEGAEVLAESTASWHRLPVSVRSRISLISIPMQDTTQNALMVNAIQQRAEIVTQKSLAEGFGLTVAEAMWKSKPVVASAVGGIQDQITDGEDGVLIRDPGDTGEFAAALEKLIFDQDLARDLGREARRSVAANYLDDSQLIRTTELLEDMLTSG